MASTSQRKSTASPRKTRKPRKPTHLEQTIERKLRKVPTRNNITESLTGTVEVVANANPVQDHGVDLSQDQKATANTLLESKGPARPYGESGSRPVDVFPASPAFNSRSL